jgi:hypothetical protein
MYMVHAKACRSDKYLDRQKASKPEGRQADRKADGLTVVRQERRGSIKLITKAFTAGLLAVKKGFCGTGLHSYQP